MTKYFFSFCLIASSFISLYSQSYELDAIRFSTHNYSGTARFVSLGGAFTSVGADFTNLSHNPAGIGMFKTTFFSVTPTVYSSKVNSTYFGNEESNNTIGLALSNIGVVFSDNNLRSQMFQNAAFGIGLNQMANYRRSEKLQALNTVPGNSITQTWVNEVNALNSGVDGNVDFDRFSFEAVNGYQTYLVNFDTSLLTYTTPITNTVRQTRFVDEEGGKSEMVFSAGANYLDRWYVGATVGVPIVNYSRYTRTIEEDTENVNGDFQDFEMEQNLDVRGMGFNLKAGVIYKPVDYIRFGLTVHTPERLNLQETYSSETESRFDSASYSYSSPQGEFNYKLRTPWRAKAGMSLFYKKAGFISFDYEIVNYASARYSFETAYEETEDAVNDLLKDKYTYGHNFSAGIEGVIKKLKLRGGYNYIGSPIKGEFADDVYNYSTHRISGGFGLLFDKVAVDLAGQYAITKDLEVPYSSPGLFVNSISRDVNSLAITATISYRFN